MPAHPPRRRRAAVAVASLAAVWPAASAVAIDAVYLPTLSSLEVQGFAGRVRLPKFIATGPLPAQHQIGAVAGEIAQRRQSFSGFWATQFLQILLAELRPLLAMSMEPLA